MNKIIIPVVVILLLLAGGWYWWANMSTKGTGNSPIQNMMGTSNDSNSDSNSKNNLTDLIKSGGSQTCTYSYTPTGNTAGAGEMSGTVYVSGGNMRSDYKMMQGDQEVTGSMIRNGDWMYMWGSTTPQGIKMQFDMEKMQDMMNQGGASAPTGATTKPTTNPNIQMDYNCKSWKADSKMFTPPSDVTFTDMSAMMKNIPTMNKDGNNCAMCDSLSGDSKDACLKQLGC